MFTAFNEGFGFPGGPGGMPLPQQQFKQFFRCYPIAMMQNAKEETNYGGKIYLPPSSLHKLTMLHITYPMLFELKAEETELKTYAGVLEFTAEEGRAYLPQWMMETLAVAPGSVLEIASTDLPSGQFVKIEPQSVDFLNISDPKAVLENELRNFTTLTVGDVFQFKYNNKVYGIKVLEVKPESDSHSICVVETDLEVDFAPPVGYEEPKASANNSTGANSGASSSQISRTQTPPVGTMGNSIGYENLTKQTVKTAFSGQGQKLSGKQVDKEPEKQVEMGIDAPALNLPFGQLFFGYKLVPLRHQQEEAQRENEEDTSHVHFQGQGQSLRQSRKRKSTKNHINNRPKGNSPEVIEIDD